MDTTQFKYRLTPKQWKNDEEWLKRRLVFIWDFAEKNPQEYVGNKLNVEKYDFYQLLPSITDKAREGR